jgi:hypothetical protein
VSGWTRPAAPGRAAPLRQPRIAPAAGPDDEHATALDVDAEVVEPFDEADAVEQRRLEAAIGQAPHRIDRARDLRHGIRRHQQRREWRLVRDGGPEATDVLGLQSIRHEARSAAAGSFSGTSTASMPWRWNKVVVDLVGTHLRNRVAPG